MSANAESILVGFAGLEKPGSIPKWAARYNVMRCTASEVSEAQALPGVIVLKIGNLNELARHRAVMKKLSERLRHAPRPCRVLVTLARTKDAKPAGFVKVLGHFPGIASNIELSVGRESLECSFYETVAKYIAIENETGDDPLGDAKEVIAAIRPLRTKSGRLSAKAIADYFGLSLSQLAGVIGRTKQSLSKTPDSPKIQLLLRPFERIARLRAILSPKSFNSWLHLQSRELDGAVPMDLIMDGRAEIVADLAEDMLLGSPS